MRFSKFYREQLIWYYGYELDRQHRIKMNDRSVPRNPDHWVNTYPLPYADPSFVPEEDADDYLVGDYWGFVRRHSTSYVAYKIFELLGKSLVRRSYFRQNKIYHAKDWGELLSQNGFERVAGPQDYGHYVAVRPNDGEYGHVFWYENARKDKGSGLLIYDVSTYRVYRHSIEEIISDDEDAVWFKIC